MITDTSDTGKPTRKALPGNMHHDSIEAMHRVPHTLRDRGHPGVQHVERTDPLHIQRETAGLY